MIKNKIIILGLIGLLILSGCQSWNVHERNKNLNLTRSYLCNPIKQYVNDSYIGESICIDCREDGCYEYKFKQFEDDLI